MSTRIPLDRRYGNAAAVPLEQRALRMGIRENYAIVRLSWLRMAMALVVVTHDARIFEFADRIARMDDGHILEVVAGAHARSGEESHP